MPIEEMKKSVLPQILMIITAALLFVLTFYFLVAINTKIKESQNIGSDTANKSTISVSKTGTVYVKPDLAVVTVTTTTDAKTASDAINQNRDKSSAVITFLKAQGVLDKYIKTVNYNVSPKYDYSATMDSQIYPPIRQPKLVGYTATESLEVKIKQLDKIGDITTGAVTAGASDVSSLNFTVENTDVVKMQARAQAIADARTDAQSIANGLGIKLGKIVGFTESGYNPIYYSYDMAKSSGIGSAPAAQPVQTGENKIDVTVNIIYEIK